MFAKLMHSFSYTYILQMRMYVLVLVCTCFGISYESRYVYNTQWIENRYYKCAVLLNNYKIGSSHVFMKKIGIRLS